MTSAPPPDHERTAQLEEELATARRTIEVLTERLERTSAGGPAEPIDQALEQRSRELEEARAEFRALTANLDQIVRHRTRALAEAESQLRAKNAELERQSKIKAEFISIAAHELRTPLTSIVGYLDLFSEGRFGDLPPMLARFGWMIHRRRYIDDMRSVALH